MNKKSDRNSEIDTGQTLARLERLTRLVRSASHTQGLNAAQWEALRYLSRANSFSNSPGALTRYLGATKGTTSQTLLSLVKKGVIEKSLRNNDARSVVLVLTEAGRKVLSNDPLSHIEKAITNLKDKTSKRFAKGLSEMLEFEVARQNEPSFGNCVGCFYASKSNDDLSCKMFNVIVNVAETQKLCVHHRTKN